MRYCRYIYIYTVTNSLSRRKVPRAEDTRSVTLALEDLTVSHTEKPAASKKVLKTGRDKPRTFTVVVVNGRHISDLQDFKISQSPAACDRPAKTQTSNDIKWYQCRITRAKQLSIVLQQVTVSLGYSIPQVGNGLAQMLRQGFLCDVLVQNSQQSHQRHPCQHLERFVACWVEEMSKLMGNVVAGQIPVVDLEASLIPFVYACTLPFDPPTFAQQDGIRNWLGWSASFPAGWHSMPLACLRSRTLPCQPQARPRPSTQFPGHAQDVLVAPVAREAPELKDQTFAKAPTHFRLPASHPAPGPAPNRSKCLMLKKLLYFVWSPLLNFINPGPYRKEKTKKRYISAGTCHKI